MPEEITYDTTLIGEAKSEIESFGSSFENLIQQLNSDVATTVTNQNEGSIVEKFQSDVFRPAVTELETQREKIKKLEQLMGIIEEDLIDTTRSIENNM